MGLTLIQNNWRRHLQSIHISAKSKPVQMGMRSYQLESI